MTDFLSAALSDHSVSKHRHVVAPCLKGLLYSEMGGCCGRLLSVQYGSFFTSTGVVSGTSLRIMMQRLWFGRTFSPVSSTCTMGEAVTKTTEVYFRSFFNHYKH